MRKIHEIQNDLRLVKQALSIVDKTIQALPIVGGSRPDETEMINYLRYLSADTNIMAMYVEKCESIWKFLDNTRVELERELDTTRQCKHKR